jgi:DNA-binding NtrC family response regulator
LTASEVVILCVDDEALPLTLRTLVLQKQGYQVKTALSAADAMQVLNSCHIDLVLTDHLMPGGTGTELARSVKQVRPNLPVILISGVNEIPPDMADTDLFISKVEGPVAMCEKISAVLAQSGRTAE